MHTVTRVHASIIDSDGNVVWCASFALGEGWCFPQGHYPWFGSGPLQYHVEEVEVPVPLYPNTAWGHG